MNPAMLIANARSDRILLSLTPTGTLKANGDEVAIRRWAPTLRAHRQALLDTLLSELALFQFNLIQREIADGYPADELRRVNNMAWQFMRHDGISFGDAIHMAAEIVATCPPADGEDAYEDVGTLWDRVTAGNQVPNGFSIPKNY